MYSHNGLPEEEQSVTTTMFVAEVPRWMQSPLGAWCFRAQRYCSSSEVAFHARHLLRTFSSAGISDLDSLKQKLDEYGARKRSRLATPKKQRAPQKVPLETVDMIAFLESIGLWCQAEVLRKHDRNQELRQKARAYDISVGVATEDASLDNKPHCLCRELLALYSAPSATEAATLLSCETADEERLRILGERSHELCPALQQLREKAVDRVVLNNLGQATDAVSEDDSMSSACEDEEVSSSFSSSDEEDNGKFMKAKRSLILTEGWRVERAKTKEGRERRVFIDPSGQRFKREADARDVIEMKEMAKRMVAKMQKRRNDAVQDGPSSSPKLKRLNTKTRFYTLCVDPAWHAKFQAPRQEELNAISPGKRKSFLGVDPDWQSKF
jgi:hypothetical protein